MSFSLLTLPTDRNWTLAELSDEKADELTVIIVYLVVLMVLGTFGNAVVMFVFYFRFKPSTHCCFIITLAFFDFWACALGLPLTIAELYNVYTYHTDVGCKLYRFYQYIVSIGSGMVLVLISVERRKKICGALGAQMTVRKAKILVVIFVVMFSVLAASPALVLCGTWTIPTGVNNMTGSNCFIAEDYRQSTFYYVFHGAMWFVALGMTSFLSYNYYFIGRKVKEMMIVQRRLYGNSTIRMSSASESDSSARRDSEPSTGTRNSTNGSRPSIWRLRPSLVGTDKGEVDKARRKSDRKSIRVTKMLVCVTVAFVISFLPHLSLLVASVVNAAVGIELPKDNLYIFIFCSYILNNIANPFIYATMDKKFRRECKDILCYFRDY